MAKKIIQSQSKPDCRRCKYGGEEKNYMLLLRSECL